MKKSNRDAVTNEFARVSKTFSKRTEGRFNDLGVVEFSRLVPRGAVLEIGAGTGSFLALFANSASRLIGVDLTHQMLSEAVRRHPSILPIVADGGALPLADGSIRLATSAQTFHHIPQPVPVLREMRRVTAKGGSVLVVDQIAPEDLNQAAAMDKIEKLRDPSHASSRPVSEYLRMFEEAGLTVIDSKLIETRELFSRWMSLEEFPEIRVAGVQKLIERGPETGMEFKATGADYLYTRRRLMLLARP